MATLTLTPNWTRVAGGWTIVGGLATHHATQADDNDATFSKGPAAPDESELRLSYTEQPVPDGAQIRSVTAWLRGSGSQADTRIRWEMYDWPSGARHVGSTYAFGTVPETIPSSARTRNHLGKTWTKKDLDNLALAIKRSTFESAVDIKAHKSFFTVDVNERPVVTVTGPADEDAATGVQVTSTSRPLVTWTYADPEGDRQERYRVKVFSAAQYGAAGFDPNASSATWDSGIVYSSATQAEVGTILANNTTYRAYVVVADVGSDGRSSLWAFLEFTMALPAPPVPVVSAVADIANYAAAISATSTNGVGEPAPEYLRYEERDDAGVWVVLPGADRVATVSGQTWTVTYREPPPNRARRYRVRSGRTVGGLEVLSEPSATVELTVANRRWRLRDVVTGATVSLWTTDDEADLVEGEPHGVFEELGVAGARVVISDRLKGESIALALSFLSAADWDAFRALRDGGNDLLLVSPLTRYWYVRFVGEHGGTLLNFAGTERRKMTARWVQVARPPRPDWLLAERAPPPEA